MQAIPRISRRHERRAPLYAASAVRVRAFSMVELTIVILIMSIFAAVSVPSFLDSLLFHRVEAAARRVKGDIDYARQRARLTSTTQTVTFTGSTYTLSNAKNIDHPGEAYTIDMLASPFLLDSATANFNSTQVITFDGYGTPVCGGTVVLVAKSHECTVTVNSVTGSTTITSNHSNGGTTQVAGG